MRFRVNGKSIYALIRKKELRIVTNQNTWSLNSNAFSYPTDRNITYAYQVKNLSEGWQSIGRSNHGYISSDPPGSYDLQLKPIKKKWSSYEFLIFIRAPFYRKPHFGYADFDVTRGFYCCTGAELKTFKIEGEINPPQTNRRTGTSNLAHRWTRTLCLIVLIP